MKGMLLLPALFMVAVLSGCAADPIPLSDSPSDPANPDAPEAPMAPPPSLTPPVTLTASPAGSSAEPIMQHHHHMHGDASASPGASPAPSGTGAPEKKRTP